MGNVIQLGSTFAEVEDRKRHKDSEDPTARTTASSAAVGGVVLSLQTETAPGADGHFGHDLRLWNERVVARKIVLQDLPARVLVDEDWMSIDLVDMSERGFSFEVDRIMGGRFCAGQRLVFSLTIPELREFTLYGRIQWTRLDPQSRQVRCGVEIIEVHGPGGGINIKELLRLLLSFHIRSSETLPLKPGKSAA